MEYSSGTEKKNQECINVCVLLRKKKKRGSLNNNIMMVSYDGRAQQTLKVCIFSQISTNSSEQIALITVTN